MLLLAALLALLLPSPAAAAWRWPVRGEVLTPFHVTPNPFARGQHRGVDIAAPAGATVRSACPGDVRFAGRIPGRGRAVTVACGPLVATYLELATTAVRRGQAVASGSRIGTVAASHLQLGARRAGRRHAYVDPLTLLRARTAPPLGAAPRRIPGARRPPAAGPARRPAPVRAPRPAPRPAERPARVPAVAWLGLAALTAGLPVGALVRRRRSRRRRSSPRTGRSRPRPSHAGR